MEGISRTRLVVLAAFAAAALAASSSGAAASPKTVNGSVGPSFTISLSMHGKKVATLKAGQAYRFVISDQSDIHDFHLKGPGVDRVLTSVDFTGTKSFVMKLKKGSYKFLCDPHAPIMHGSFRVV
jgi:plastocyanin